MATVQNSITFPYLINLVWEAVTDTANASWRSDLNRIEVCDDTHFIEYSKEDIATSFTILQKQVPNSYVFTMENENMKGTWTGRFQACEAGTTFFMCEDVTAKKAFLKPFVKAYLKKQQAQYIKDLTRRLDELAHIASQEGQATTPDEGEQGT